MIGVSRGRSDPSATPPTLSAVIGCIVDSFGKHGVHEDVIAQQCVWCVDIASLTGGFTPSHPLVSVDARFHFHRSIVVDEQSKRLRSVDRPSSTAVLIHPALPPLWCAAATIMLSIPYCAVSALLLAAAVVGQPMITTDGSGGINIQAQSDVTLTTSSGSCQGSSLCGLLVSDDLHCT